MNMLDYAMLGVLGISALAGLRRGLVAEALILAGWLVSFVLARSLAGAVGQWLPLALPGDQARWLLGFVAVMAAGWLGFFLLRQALAGVLRVTGLSGVDRVLGLAFGLARGGLLLTLAVLLASLTELPKHPAWQASALARPFEQFALAARAWLPADMAARVRFAPGEAQALPGALAAPEQSGAVQPVMPANPPTMAGQGSTHR